MIKVFKEVSQQQLGIKVCEFVLYFNETFVRMQNELLKPVLKVLKIDKVLEGELDHVARIVYFFVLVEDVESF